MLLLTSSPCRLRYSLNAIINKTVRCGVSFLAFTKFWLGAGNQTGINRRKNLIGNLRE